MIKKRTTIADVARDARVAESTVSLVLNDSSSVAPETAMRIRSSMQALGYQPRKNRRRAQNRTEARQARETHSGQIAFLVPDSNPAAAMTWLMQGIVAGASDYLHGHDRDIVALPLRPNGDLPLAIVRGQVDGVIFRGGGKLGEQQCAVLAGLPCVTLFELSNTVIGDIVAPDADEEAREALHHLMSQGCRRLIACSPNANNQVFRRMVRIFAFEASLQGIDCQIVEIEQSGELPPAVDAALAGDSSGVGLFLAGYTQENSETAMEAYIQSLGTGGPLGPRTISVTNRQQSHPTIGVARERVGKAAAEQLLWRMAHPQSDIRRVLLQPTFQPAVDSPLNFT